MDEQPSVSLVPVPRKGDRSLFQHPQYLGIMPTGWFWSWGRMAKAACITGPIAVVLASAVVAFATGPVWMLAGLLMVPSFSLGITERMLRTIAKRRQQRALPQ